MDDFNLNPNPAPNQSFEPAPRPVPPPSASEETTRLNQEIPRKNQLLDSGKNILVVLILIAVIVGSFWISFQLGKRLLVPVKKTPQDKIEVTIPEAPASIAHMQKLQKLAGLSGESKAVNAKPKIVTAKTQSAAGRQSTCQRRASSSTAVSGHYYKLQAGVFAHKTNAVNLVNSLKSKGVEAFAKPVGSKWRVQAGAYRDKNDALAAKRALKNKGYDSILIYE